MVVHEAEAFLQNLAHVFGIEVGVTTAKSAAQELPTENTEPKEEVRDSEAKSAWERLEETRREARETWMKSRTQQNRVKSTDDRSDAHTKERKPDLERGFDVDD